MNYDGKKFRPLQNSNNGETTQDTIFHYQQTENILTSEYAGGKIDMRYHQVNTDGELMTGFCSSKPEITKDGKIRLHESWQWTSGDRSQGNSILEEL